MSALIAYVVFGTPASILRAWVVQHLWVWFVTPTFDLGAPNMATLYGLSWFVGLLWPLAQPPGQDADQSLAMSVVTPSLLSVFMSVTGLACGAIAHGIAS